ncbi:MAG: hypothetical protein FIB08_00145 [Candidatus Methanoperedens sp.]|nr:hypothetical protein [Candidatus Methanoperedens sp.]
MEDKCPKCGNFLITKTIKKELGHGSIDYPVSQMCPKCNWSKDLTGAGDIAPKPLAVPEEEIKKEVVKPAAAPVKIRPKSESPSSGMNTVIIVVLAIFVIAVLAWVFLPPAPKQSSEAPTPTPTPAITGSPVATATVVIANTPVIEVTPTGVQKWIQLDSYRIFRNDASNIKVGDKVTWKNIGKDPFTLLSNNIPDFGEKLLDNEKITSYIFKKAGTYGFYLKNNENLNGTIIVET